MGIGIAAGYIPLYLIISSISLFVGIRVSRSFSIRTQHLIAGLLIGTFATLAFIWVVFIRGNTSWNDFFIQAGASLLGPIIIGSILFIASSVSASNKTEDLFKGLAVGSLYAVIGMPWVAIFASIHYYDVTNYWSYNNVCKSAEVRYLLKVPPAKSVLLKPDRFIHPGGNEDDIALFLLNQSLLDSVERPPKKDSEFYGIAPIEQLRIKGERILQSSPGSNESTEFLISGLDFSTAEYTITSSRIEMPKLNKKGIGGARIEIHRNSDHKLIAYTQYYWDKKTRKYCPKMRRGAFLYRFVATALNVLNPNGINEGAEQIQSKTTWF